MMAVKIPIPAAELSDFCQRWKITELALFGSALHGDDHPESDIDLLVTFASDSLWSLFDLASMQNELQELLGRPVDLVERSSVERSENYIRRRNILTSVEILYEA